MGSFMTGVPISYHFNDRSVKSQSFRDNKIKVILIVCFGVFSGIYFIVTMWIKRHSVNRLIVKMKYLSNSQSFVQKHTLNVAAPPCVIHQVSLTVLWKHLVQILTGQSV